MTSHIQKLLEKSRQVIADCCIENGAIVAANTDKEYFPKGVNNYRFVWVRDASFILYAANLLGMKDLKEPFLKWLTDRAEGFAENGKISQRYGTHGVVGPYYGGNYQPDQAGALIWLLAQEKELSPLELRILGLAADGLVTDWQTDHFKVRVFDCWEQKHSIPELKDNFPYTLVACSYGLEKAHNILGKEKYKVVSDEMKQILLADVSEFYPKRTGVIPDKKIDASILGIVWPFDIIKDDAKLERTIQEIEEKLLSPEGVHRHEYDEYDGNVEHLKHWLVGAGGWPLLTFWYVIALSKTGRMEDAKKYFEAYVEKFEAYIPEQVFDNDLQKAVSPLCWSHAMFVIAAKELGYF